MNLGPRLHEVVRWPREEGKKLNLPAAGRCRGRGGKSAEGAERTGGAGAAKMFGGFAGLRKRADGELSARLCVCVGGVRCFWRRDGIGESGERGGDGQGAGSCGGAAGGGNGGGARDSKF